MTDKKTNAPKSNVRLVAEFAVNGDLGAKEFKDTLPYDCITSMFTLHYFFESEASLKQLLHNVSVNLKPGGVFFGCVPDGKRVLEALRSKQEYNSRFLTIVREFEGAAEREKNKAWLFRGAYLLWLCLSVRDRRHSDQWR